MSTSNPSKSCNPKIKIVNFQKLLTALKYSLLTNKISPKAFRDALFDADQSTDDRRSSQHTYYFLKEPEIENYFIKTEFKTDYLLLLSFTTFHYAQYAARYKRDQGMALELFTESLSQRLQMPESVLDLDSVLYVQATIAYFSADVAEMERLKCKMNPESDFSINISVIDRLIKGINTYHNVDYVRDYFGVEHSKC